jgi:hypothetical protein
MDISSVFLGLLVFGVLGMGHFIVLAIDNLRNSLASDSSKVQALLAEIRDKLGK